MKNPREKMRWKNFFDECLVEGRGGGEGKNLVRPRCFLFGLTKIFSLQNEEKNEGRNLIDKWQKNLFIRKKKDYRINRHNSNQVLKDNILNSEI